MLIFLDIDLLYSICLSWDCSLLTVNSNAYGIPFPCLTGLQPLNQPHPQCFRQAENAAIIAHFDELGRNVMQKSAASAGLCWSTPIVVPQSP